MATPSVLLLASRDPQLVYLLQRYAGNCGCQLLQSENSTAMFNAIAQTHPALILLDVSQANAEGRQALRELKSSESTRLIPVVLCDTSESDWQDCEAEGRLLQPILFNDFARALSEAGLPISQVAKEA